MVRWFLILAGLLFALPAQAQSPIDTALRDMCGRDMVALGEPAGHGDARTIEAKTELVRRLIDECGFGAVFFEGSTYDFLELERRRGRGAPVDRAMLSSAIGGLWNRHVEAQPLIDLLWDRFAAGRVRLGGIDDQLGSAGAFYSIDGLPDEVAALLSEGDRPACRAEMRRLIYGQLGPAREELAPVAECFAKVRRALDARGPDAERDHLLVNMQRYALRSGMTGPLYAQLRDAAMWSNFHWLRARLPQGTKIILWTATVHAARDATAYPLFAGGGNLGGLLLDDYGNRAFILAFGAAGGQYRTGGQVRDIAPAAPGSLEADALAGVTSDTVYLGKVVLRTMGSRPGGLFDHAPVTADWAAIVDGAIIFRSERAPGQAPR